MITDRPASSSPMATSKEDTPCLSRPDGFWSLPRCSVALLDAACSERLVVAGVLDAASLPAFTAQVDQLMCTPCREVHLDLAGVSSMDEAAGNAVMGLQSYVSGRGGQITITWPRPSDTAALETATGPSATVATPR